MNMISCHGSITVHPGVPEHVVAELRLGWHDAIVDGAVHIWPTRPGEEYSEVVPVLEGIPDPDKAVADLNELIARIGPGHTYDGALICVARHTGDHFRIRVVDGKAVVEPGAVVFPADYVIPAGPAVVFDPAAATAWLMDPVEGRRDRRGECYYNVFPTHEYDPCIGPGPGDWLGRIIPDLDEYNVAPQVWQSAPGVRVSVIETVGMESSSDGGAVLVVEVGRLRLASRFIEADDLARRYHADEVTPVTQLEAAVDALYNAAAAVNAMVEEHRLVRATDQATAAVSALGGLAGQLTPDELECALVTLAELWTGTSLEDLSGVQHDVADDLVASLLPDDEDQDEELSYDEVEALAAVPRLTRHPH
jgi:hypothetical protein